MAENSEDSEDGKAGSSKIVLRPHERLGSTLKSHQHLLKGAKRIKRAFEDTSSSSEAEEAEPPPKKSFGRSLSAKESTQRWDLVAKKLIL